MPHPGSPRQQASLAGFEPAAATDRLFFAVFPDPATAARIAALARSLHDQHRLRGKPLRADRLHVTLHHLGDHAGLPRDIVDAAGQAAERTAETEPFQVAFDSASSFAGRSRNRPCVLRGAPEGLAPLVVLQQRLGTAMAATGLARHVGRDFTPHVTLLYDDRSLEPPPVERVEWTVRDFVLVHSLLGRTEHRILGRWPLRA